MPDTSVVRWGRLGAPPFFWSRAWRLAPICGFCVLLVGCSSDGTEPALIALGKARKELWRAPVGEASGPAAELIEITRKALEDAELEVRRYQGRMNPFSSPDGWELKVKKALGLTEVAAWVSHRDAKLLREEIETFLRATHTAVELHRRSRHFNGLPQGVRGNLVKATLTADEASHWVEQGRLLGARDKAEEAYRIAGGVDLDVEDLLGRFRDPAKLKIWTRWVESTVSQSRHRRALVVDKRRRLAILYEDGKARAWLEVDIGRNSLREKYRAGDGATPEGIYHITRKKGSPETRFYKALLLDYPNDADRARFDESIRAGLIPRHSRIGGLIEIHGEGGSGTDWTDGCIAVSNRDMDFLFAKLSAGSQVAIVGSYEVRGN